MNKTIFLTGIILGLSAIALGAFGAHGLEGKLSADSIQTFETGVKYQMYHALFLLVVGSLSSLPESSKKWIFFITLAGVILFSFSIYFLATNALTDFDFSSIGFVTPMGGLLLMTAWGLLGFGCLKHFN